MSGRPSVFAASGILRSAFQALRGNGIIKTSYDIGWQARGRIGASAGIIAILARTLNRPSQRLAVIGNKHGFGKRSQESISILIVKSAAVGIGQIAGYGTVGCKRRTVHTSFKPPRSQLESGFFGSFPGVKSGFRGGARLGALAKIGVVFFGFAALGHRVQIGEFFAADS